VVIDANSKRLKKCFAPIIKDDIINNSIKNISKDKEEKSQVHVREINFFYMVERMRERIVFSNNRYSVNNTDIVFSEEEILKEIEKNPEKFSPNVITRCLYQEHILPNICYIGGPAEVTYWLEFKKFFDKYKINYPVVVPRDFVLLLTKRNQKTLTKYGIELSQLFVGKKNVIETILNIYSDNKNNFDDEIKKIKEAYESLVDKYSSIDKSMSGNVESKSKQTIKSIVELEKKYKKAQKSSNAKLIQNIDNLYGSLFGNNSSQERYENFLYYYVSDETFIANLVDILNPLVLNYKIIKL
jgi:bacillithiol biosynthesis cysteine-adding enzyme BshC